MIATCNSKTLVEGLEIKLVNSTYVALTTNRVQGNGMRLLVASDLPSSTQNLPQTIQKNYARDQELRARLKDGTNEDSFAATERRYRRWF
jgi:hypothetical protein